MSDARTGAADPLGSVLLAGAGRMGKAMLDGWLAMGLPGPSLTVLDPAPSTDLVTVCQHRSVRLNPTSLATPDILVLAVKPQMLDAAVPTLSPVVQEKTLLLSVIAGKTTADLTARFPAAGRIVRAMPNTPAAVGRGITGVAGPTLSGSERSAVERLLGAIGTVEWLRSEAEIDAVTAVSGSGPAYVFYLAECLAKAGEAAGLDPAVAARLARATVEGAGELMFRTPESQPSDLRRNVTSPAGTTAAALEVLTAPDGLEPLLARAVAAAQRRAGELAG